LDFGGINLSNGSYTLGSVAGNTFGLDFVDADNGSGLFADLYAVGSIQWGSTNNYVDSVALNGAINASVSTQWGGAARLFGGYGYGLAGNWAVYANESVTGFAPLRINAGDGNYHYGWAEITTQAGNISSPPYLGAVTVTVTGFAFNTNLNEAIGAGAIPEPSTVACLLLGGSAFAFSRRRRLESHKLAS